MMSQQLHHVDRLRYNFYPSFFTLTSHLCQTHTYINVMTGSKCSTRSTNEWRNTSSWTFHSTLWLNKTQTQTFCDNFGKCRPILIIFSLLHSAVNSGKSFYITCHLTSNLLPYYLVKFECSIEQKFTIVIQFKKCAKSYRLFSVNIWIFGTLGNKADVII